MGEEPLLLPQLLEVELPRKKRRRRMKKKRKSQTRIWALVCSTRLSMVSWIICELVGISRA